jgi:predicted DsbA family dithiol-disulfide isomerase
MLADRDDLKARALQLAFLAQYDVTEKQFNEAYDSMSVSMNMQRAEKYTQEMLVDGVPMLFVNGKYSTTVGAAGGEAQLITLLTDLAESEKR